MLSVLGWSKSGGLTYVCNGLVDYKEAERELRACLALDKVADAKIVPYEPNIYEGRGNGRFR